MSCCGYKAPWISGPDVIGCAKPTVMRYPCNEPDNGPARQYCPEGHSTCYNCGAWFECISGEIERDWCTSCEEAHNLTHCSCGMDPKHRHKVPGPEEGEELSWLCCGDPMCCEGDAV